MILPRLLANLRLADILKLAIPAHLATLDPVGFPCILPLWFLWEYGPFPTLVLPKRTINNGKEILLS